MIELKIDTANLRKQLAPLAAFPKQAQAAVYQSLKKTMTGIRTEIGRGIKSRSTLAASRVSEAIGKPVVTGGGTHLEGSVHVASKAPSLTQYQIAPRRQTAQRGKRPAQWRTLQWRIEKGGGFKKNDPEGHYTRAFAVQTRDGALMVMRRHRAGKKLQKQFGPRVQYFMAFDSLQEHLQATARERFERTLAHEVQYRLGKLGGGK